MEPVDSSFIRVRVESHAKNRIQRPSTVAQNRTDERLDKLLYFWACVCDPVGERISIHDTNTAA